MAYIAPNSEIALLKNVPLDASYDHTITFANSAQQYLYFRGKVADGNGRIFPQNSYQRTSSNKIRLELGMDEAIQYNYLYFRNISFENKYFYAFITNWEYVNNITTEITYEIDVMQSFITNAIVKQCFVEREHIQNDQIGANLVPEGLEQGDYIVDGISEFNPYTIEGLVATNASAIFYCTFQQNKDEQGQVTGYSKFNGGVLHYVYTGLCPIVIGSEGGIRQFISDVTSPTFPYADGIVAAYMCPFEPLTYSDIEWGFRVGKHITSLAGYVPKNKKLFTAPYNMLRVVTDSDSETYNFEYFRDPSFCEFNMLGYFLPEPVLSLVPKNYKSATNRNYCLEHRMTIREFPQIAVDIDVWKVYFAQHGASLITSMIGQGVETGAKVLAASQGGALAAGSSFLDPHFNKAGNMTLFSDSAPHASNMSGGISVDPVSTLNAASSFTGIATSLAQVYELTKRPPELKGTQTSLADFSIGAKKFYAQNICIRPEFAKIIDDYFTMFGYATHQVKVPNIRGRRYFNYVQTKACILEGAIPEIYKQKMINIFNNGITFWHTENLASVADVDNIIGDYTVANEPV